MNNQGMSMVRTQNKPINITNIVLPLVGWLCTAVAVFIDGSFVQEFALIAVARVLP